MESVKTWSGAVAHAMNPQVASGQSALPGAPSASRSAPASAATTRAGAPLAPPPAVDGRSGQSVPPVAPSPPLALVLDEIVAAVEGLHGALLASVDGFAIARSSTMPNSAAHAAILAAGMGLAHQLAAMGGGNELRQLVIDHDEGLLLLWPIGTQRALALLTARRVDQTAMRRSVQSHATWLAGTA